MFFEPFILAGSFWFVLLFLVFGAAMIAAVEYDKGWGATWATVAFVIILSEVTDVAVVSYVLSNPLGALYYVGLYFAAGSVWGVSKWWFYCRKLLDVARDMKILFLTENNITGNVIPDNKRTDFIASLTDPYSDYSDRSFPPQAMAHKSDWMMWATYWPVSAFWTLLNQPIKYIWQMIYSHLGNFMQKISNQVFKEI